MGSVIHNADEAMALLTHRRTGKRLDSLLIAKNTKLIYASDSIVALTFRGEPIAWYAGDKTILDIKQWANLGVSQRTRWRRIKDFTVVKPFTQNCLRMVTTDLMAADHTYPVLYEPRLHFNEQGECLNPMKLGRQRQITDAAKWWIHGLRDHARKCVEHWDDLTRYNNLCDFCADEGLQVFQPQPAEHFRIVKHFSEHVEYQQYVLPKPWRDEFTNSLANSLAHGHRPEQTMKQITKHFTTWLIYNLLPYAVERADPERKYIFPHSRKPTYVHLLNEPERT